MSNDEQTAKVVTRFAILGLVVIVLVVAFASWFSVRRLDLFREDCLAAGGHVDNAGVVSICLDKEGNIIDIPRRFF